MQKENNNFHIEYHFGYPWIVADAPPLPSFDAFEFDRNNPKPFESLVCAEDYIQKIPYKKLRSPRKAK